MLKKAIETPEKNSLSDIETDFVNHAIEKSKELTIFLVNGIKLEGTIIAMGSNSFLLKRDGNVPNDSWFTSPEFYDCKDVSEKSF